MGLRVVMEPRATRAAASEPTPPGRDDGGTGLARAPDGLTSISNTQTEIQSYVTLATLSDAPSADLWVRQIAHSLPVCIAYCDPGQRFVFVNQAYAERFGLTPGQLAGCGLRDVLGDETYERYRPHVERVLAGESVDYEAETPPTTTGPRNVRVAFRPDVDAAGRVRGFVAMLWDITPQKQAEQARDEVARQSADLARANRALQAEIAERRRAEAALRESEALNRLILDSSPDCISVLDADGRLSSVNRSGRRMLEIGDDAPLAPTGWARFWRDAAGDPAARRAVRAAAAGAIGAFVGCWPTESGDVRWWDVLVMPLAAQPSRLAPGRRPGPACQVLAVARDVTEWRRAERELQAAKVAAEEASLNKGQFLANMSHEIRTPLTAILGYAELLLTTPDLSAADRDRWTRTIEAGGRRLLALVNDVLDLSKIEAGRMPVRLAPCSPAAVVDEVVSLLAPAAAAKGLNLTVEFGPDVPPAALTDADKVRQILTNLVGNAVKFTARGSVRVFVAVRAVVPGGRQAGGGVEKEPAGRPALCFDVVDTGPGLAAAGLGRLFQPFVQGDDSAAGRQGGTGLGLSISRDLARALGGDVTAASVPGRGSTFTAAVPFQQIGPAAAVPPEVPVAAA